MSKNHVRTIAKEIGSTKELALLIGTSYSNMRSIVSGERRPAPWMVKKLAALSNGKVTEKRLRPDIF